MALTKANIAELIAEKNDLQQSKAQEITEMLLEIVKSTLEAGEDVLISGFGKFQVKEKNARIGRNPATGDTMRLPSRRVVTFKCSWKLRDKINRA